MIAYRFGKRRIASDKANLPTDLDKKTWAVLIISNEEVVSADEKRVAAGVTYIMAITRELTDGKKSFQVFAVRALIRVNE